MFCHLQTRRNRLKYSSVFCSKKDREWDLCAELPSTSVQQGWFVIIWLSFALQCFSCFSAVQSRFEDRFGIYRSDVGVEKWDSQLHNLNLSRLAPLDFLRRLFVLSAVFCANWRVKPSSFTFRGTDDAVDPWKRPWAPSPPAAAGETVTGMSNELNTMKSLHSFISTPRLSLSPLSLRLWFTVCL